MKKHVEIPFEWNDRFENDRFEIKSLRIIRQQHWVKCHTEPLSSGGGGRGGQRGLRGEGNGQTLHHHHSQQHNSKQTKLKFYRYTSMRNYCKSSLSHINIFIFKVALKKMCSDHCAVHDALSSDPKILLNKVCQYIIYTFGYGWTCCCLVMQHCMCNQ